MTAQSDFIAAVLNSAAEVPTGLRDPAGRPAGRRFSVYRNNVAVSLTEALELAFPAIVKLVGEDFFRMLAGAYLRAHPPASPLMMFYGGDLPDFLEMFDPVKSLPYLPDIARLEVAIRQSYHAADAAPIDPARLGAVSGSGLMSARLTLAPAVRVVRSAWPVRSIWAATMADGAKPRMAPENALITRPEFDPTVAPLDDAGADFVLALLRGDTIGQAVEAAGDGLDLTAVMSALIAGRAITGLKTGDHDEHVDRST